jgi:16S rRNA (guanine527-N7)-methyltransferase
MMLDFSIRYLQILKTSLSGLNLTNIMDSDEFYNKQILDSINPYLQSKFMQSEVARTKRVVDIGFGGGFPILPLAKILPEVEFIGVESRRKKVDAVRLIAQELGLKNVRLVHSRLEDVSINLPAVITFKAVGTVGNYLPLINSPSSVVVFFYKGPGYQEVEMEAAQQLPGWKQIALEEIEVPMTERRLLVTFRGQNVPRGTAKKLVKLNELL